MTEQAVNADFRTSVRDWLSTNFPKSLAGRLTGMEAESREDVIRWL